jgi:phage-related protein
VARLDVEIAADVTGQGDIDGMADKFGNLEKIGTGAMERIGHKITDFATNLISSGINSVITSIGDSITLASDKAESAGKANILFGDSYGVVEAASKNAADTVGLSSGKYLEMVGVLGNLTTNLGYTGEEASTMSVDMLQLAADMGSFNNASTEDVVFAMGAAFRGETEPIRAYGVFLDDARVKAEAVRLGLYDGVGALDANAKAQATYSLILQQTTAAQGDFARTSDGYANSSKIAAAKQEEAWTAFGEKLLPLATAIIPLVTGAVEVLVGVLSVLADNAPFVIGALLPLGILIAVAIVPPFLAWAAATLLATWPLIAISVAAGVLFMALKELGVIDWLIGLFGALASMVGGVVNSAIKVVQDVLRSLQPTFDQVGVAVGGLGNLFGQAFRFMSDAVGVAIGLIRGLIDNVFKPIFDGVVKVAQAMQQGVQAAWGLVKSGIDAAIGLIKGVIDNVLRPIFDGVVKVAQDMQRGAQGAWDLLKQAIGTAIGLIKGIIDNVLKPIFDGVVRIAQDMQRGAQAAFDLLKQAIGAAIGLIKGLIDNVLRPIFDSVVKVAQVMQQGAQKAWELLKAGIDVAIGLIKGIIDRVLKPVFDGLIVIAQVMQKGVQAAWDLLKSGIDAVAKFVKIVVDVIADSFKWVQTQIGNVINGITGFFGNLIRAAQDLARKVAEFLGNMFQPLVDGINKAVGLAKDIWNGFVRFWNGFQIVIPAIAIGDFQITPKLVIGLPKLPHLAAGGIVTGPTLALIGEAGPEAVIPLTGRNRPGGGVTVNIYTGVGDPVAIGREVRLALDAYERASGTY